MCVCVLFIPFRLGAARQRDAQDAPAQLSLLGRVGVGSPSLGALQVSLVWRRAAGSFPLFGWLVVGPPFGVLSLQASLLGGALQALYALCVCVVSYFRYDARVFGLEPLRALP